MPVIFAHFWREIDRHFRVDEMLNVEPGSAKILEQFARYWRSDSLPGLAGCSPQIAAIVDHREPAIVRPLQQESAPYWAACAERSSPRGRIHDPVSLTVSLSA